MGYDTARFIDVVDEELVCSICCGVLDNPLQVPKCEHAFCKNCIKEWILIKCSCPIDRSPLTYKQLQPVPRIMRNLLAKLLIKCEYDIQGCTESLRLENFHTHRKDCLFNPKKPVRCGFGCELLIPKDEVNSHSCVKTLRDIVRDQRIEIDELTTELVALKRSKVTSHNEDVTNSNIFPVEVEIETTNSSNHSQPEWPNVPQEIRAEWGMDPIHEPIEGPEGWGDGPIDDNGQAGPEGWGDVPTDDDGHAGPEGWGDVPTDDWGGADRWGDEPTNEWDDVDEDDWGSPQDRWYDTHHNGFHSSNHCADNWGGGEDDWD